MKRLRIIPFLVVLLASVTMAQQPAQPDMYLQLTYSKVAPENEEAYRTFVTTMSTKFYQELMNVNANLVHWSSAVALYPGPDGPGYNYVGAAIFSGPPPEPGANLEEVYRKAVGISQADYQKKLQSLRTIVGTELLVRVAGTTIGNTKVGDFRVATQVKHKPGMGGEHHEYARTQTLPIWQERVATGEVSGWSLWSRVFPWGSHSGYDDLGVVRFRDLASAIKGPDGSKTAAIFAKVHPDKNYAAYINNGQDYSEPTMRQMTRVIAVVERAPR